MCVSVSVSVCVHMCIHVYEKAAAYAYAITVGVCCSFSHTNYIEGFATGLKLYKTTNIMFYIRHPKITDYYCVSIFNLLLNLFPINYKYTCYHKSSGFDIAILWWIWFRAFLCNKLWWNVECPPCRSSTILLMQWEVLINSLRVSLTAIHQVCILSFPFIYSFILHGKTLIYSNRTVKDYYTIKALEFNSMTSRHQLQV